MKNLSFLLALGVAVLSTPAVHAQLYTDNFDALGATPVTATSSGTYAGYTVNMASTDNRVIFGYDYGAAGLGITSAPNSSGGSTIGVRFDANLTVGAVSSLAITPATSTFSGNFALKFDLWMNTIGPFPGGGAGSSEHFTAGVGYNGATFQSSTSGSGVWFAADGDGGFSGTSTTPDYQARINTSLQAPGSGVYTAGTATGSVGASVDNANTYYVTNFPGQASPAGQSPAATGPDGSLAWKWHQVEIDRNGNTVTWSIDGKTIATVSDANALASDRIVIGYWDASSSKDAGNVFGLIDNVTVSTVPEPAAGMLGLVAGILVLARRRKQK